MTESRDWIAQARERLFIADGAMGTELRRFGLPAGANIDRACLTHPHLVVEAHQRYLAAGAELIETNSFGANPIRLGCAGLEEECAAINKAAVALARAAAGPARAVIAGAVGPLGAALAPIGNLAADEAARAFRAQIEVLAGEGVDLILLETFIDLQELVLAAEVALGTGLPVLASLAFDEEGFTAAGVSAARAAGELAGLPLVGLGANCGAGPDGLARVAEMLGPCLHPDQLLCLMPNAGLPRRQEGRTVFHTDPAYFAAAARRLHETGANIIGGCCGTGAEHIAALAGEVKGQTVRPRSKEAPPPAAPDAAEPRWLSPFLAKLGKRFVCSVELESPKGPDPSAAIQAGKALAKAGADAVNVTDGPMARVRMGSIALAHRLQEEAGIEVILHLTCRDRNLIGLQADLLGAAALGVRNVLALTGDPPKVGDHPQATAVFDVNANGLVRIMDSLNRGRDLAGNSLGRASSFCIGVAANPCAGDPEAELARLKDKFEAGADFCLTQPIFDPVLAGPFLEEVARWGKPLVAGVWPLRSLRQAEYLAHEVPGFVLPESLLQRMRDCPVEKQGETGEIAAGEILRALRPRCAGVCLMTGRDHELALRMVRMVRSQWL